MALLKWGAILFLCINDESMFLYRSDKNIAKCNCRNSI